MNQFNRPRARKPAYAKATADKGGSKMKNSTATTVKAKVVIGIGVAVIAMVLILWAYALVFAGTAGIDVHEDGPDTLLGVGYGEDGKYQRIVEFRKGSELRGEEVIAFREAFFEIKERLPEKSYFEIARFPQVPRYIVKFSDGHVYVAIGTGPTIKKAFISLVVNFK